MRFKKTDIETHSDNGYGAGYPAVKVKVYHVGCDTSDVIAMFPTCSEAQAEKALEFAFTSECESFWDYWADTSGTYENGLTGSAEYAYFPGDKPRVYSAGRSGGWLIVQGLAPVEDWDAVMVARWAKFEKAVKADIKYRMSKDALLEGIESNSWWKEHSSQYNHVDGKDGTLCLADIRAEVDKYVAENYGLSLAEVCNG
jgi:hypothetical protein